MKSFFADMNFPRAVIFLMLIGSLALGWFVYDRNQRLSELDLELKRAPGVVREIQELALQLDGLQRAASKEGLTGEKAPEVFIRSVAAKNQVNIGQVEISRTTKSVNRNVEDLVLTIKPDKNSRNRYSRTAIGNFLWMLEYESRKVKVTSLELRPVSRLKPGQIGDDVWTFEADITSRQAVEN